MSDTIAEKIEEAIDKPKSVQSDAGSVSQHSIPDLIAADKHLAQKEAASNSRNMGIRLGKFNPPGHF